jgi:hypothetical protein
MSEEHEGELPEEFAAAVEAEQKKVRKPRAEKVEAPVSAALSEEDIEGAKAKAREEVRAELKRKALKEVMEAEKEKLRREAAGETGDHYKDEIVSCTIDLAEHSSHIMLDMNRYDHGYTYKVRRSVAETLREIMQRTHQHQDQIEGRSLTDSLRRARNTRFNGSTGNIDNTPQRAA